MTIAIARVPIYRRRRFQPEIIELCVRWYLTYRLSYRDLVEMLAERDITVSHSTILRWVQRYVPEFEKRWGRLLGGCIPLGEWMKPRFQSGAAPTISTVLWINTEKPLIPCCARIAANRLLGHSLAKPLRPISRGARAK
jgi:hypothetical protein